MQNPLTHECLCRYHGNDRSMLIPNTLFRMGAAAMIMTSRMSERRRAKYELEHTVRVHIGANTTAYEYVLSLQLPVEGRTSASRQLLQLLYRPCLASLSRLGQTLHLPASAKVHTVACASSSAAEGCSG